MMRLHVFHEYRTALLLMFSLVCIFVGSVVLSTPCFAEENEAESTSVFQLSGMELKRAILDAHRRWKNVSDTHAEVAAREYLALFHALEADTELPRSSKKSLTRGVTTKLDALSSQISAYEKREKRTNSDSRPASIRRADVSPEMGQLNGGMNIGNGGNDGSLSQKTEENGENLVEVIQNTIHPESWEQNGGSGTIRFWQQGNHLIIRQTNENHEEIQNLLDQLRRAGS